MLFKPGQYLFSLIFRYPNYLSLAYRVQFLFRVRPHGLTYVHEKKKRTSGNILLFFCRLATAKI